jgi:uridine kinase
VALDQLLRGDFVLVGIDGRGGSGKTTLAVSLGGVVVHGDDFYRPMPTAERLRLDAEGGYHRYFDWQRLRDQVLLPLRDGRPARYQRYDWPTGEVDPECHEVAPTGVVVVEGCYSVRPELAGFYDVTVHVDTPREVCLARVQARGDDHGPWDWNVRWQAAEDFYLRTTALTERVTLVVRGWSA